MRTPLPPFHLGPRPFPCEKSAKKTKVKGTKNRGRTLANDFGLPHAKKNTVTPQLVRSDEIRADALPTAPYAAQIGSLETSPSSREHQLLYARSATNHHHRWDTPSQPEHPFFPFRHEGNCVNMRTPQIFFHTSQCPDKTDRC